MAAPRKQVQQGGKQAAAKRITTKKKVADAAAEVKAAREAGEAMEVSTVDAWKQSSARKPVRLKLPSGHVCEAINKGFQAFVLEGGIPNPLMPLVMEAVNSGKGVPTKQLSDMSKDPDALVNMMQMVDNIVVSSVTSPVIQPTPSLIEDPDNPEGPKIEPERDPQLLYVDELDLDDKMFVMQWFMGGVKDLDRFREQQTAVMAALQSSN
jgi:hypothetical protein